MDNTDKTKKENTEQPEKEMKLSGDDIMTFFRKLFRAGNARKVVWKDEDGRKVFALNLVITLIIVFIVPVLALLAMIPLIVMNHSLTIEKKGDIV